MAKTFDESLKDTAKISMSMLDVSDYDDTTSEEFETLRREQQGCHNELTHRDDFPFGLYSKKVVLNPGQNTCSIPDGQVKNIYYKNKKLVEENNYLLFDAESQGKPQKYAIKDNPEKIVIYPTPQEREEIIVEYYDDRFVEDTQGEYQWEISVGSTLRMPERVQHLYFDALEYFLLADHYRKQTNARWQPTLMIARDRWKTFLAGARRSDSETYFVI